MTNHELETKLQKLVTTERRTTLEILQLIREAEERRLPLKKGYKSTHDWLTKEYKYSASAANRRIQAARLLKAVPKAEEKLEEGTVNLTTMAKVQSAIYREEKRSGERMKPKEKEELLSKVEGKTENEAEKEICTLFPEEAKKESLRQVNEQEARLSILLGAEGVELLKRVRDLFSHAMPNASWAEVVTCALRKIVQSETGAKSKSHRGAKAAKEMNEPKSTKETKSCEYVDPASGRRCGSTYQLETDHIIPKAHGGTDDPANLRRLCKQHNLLEAERKLGKEFMKKYRRTR